jgi:hypothetical protein
MIKKFTTFNRSGISTPVNIGYSMDVYKNLSDKEYSDYFDGSSIGFSWVFNDQRIILFDEKVDVFAYPTVDNKYVIAIYKGLNNKFSPPNNAVVYNLDGSVHKILKTPKLISLKILEKIKQEKHSNPPIEDNEYGRYGMGLEFVGFGWYKDENENLVNTISIKYGGEYGEWRIFNPETGEFGKMTSDWFQSRSWR